MNVISKVLFILLCGSVSWSEAGLLNPGSYSPIDGGSAFPSLIGTYSFSTSGLTPTLTLPDGSTISGVLDPTGSIAVFAFSSISISDGMTIVGAGSRPLALLTEGGFSLTGTGVIEVNGGPGSNMGSTSVMPGPGGPGGGDGGSGGRSTFNGSGTGGTGSAGDGPGGGSGGLGIGNGAGGGGGGGGFGGMGGAGGTFRGGAGGDIYGNLDSMLQGGSGGGGSGGFSGQSGIVGFGGGGGGGALEIGALGNIVIGGAGIHADGGDSSRGGGGSGGGIIIDGESLLITSIVSAQGGASQTGGGGGGGSILLSAPSIFVEGTIDVDGGVGGSNNGAMGVQSSVVPEPSSILMAAIALLVGCGWTRVNRYVGAPKGIPPNITAELRVWRRK